MQSSTLIRRVLCTSFHHRIISSPIKFIPSSPTHYTSINSQCYFCTSSFHTTPQFRFIATTALPNLVVEVGAIIAGVPQLPQPDLNRLTTQLELDAITITKHIVALIESTAADKQEHGDELSSDQSSRERKPAELSLVFCDDTYITKLNKEWRGKDGPTDVLSFEMTEDEDTSIADDAFPVTILGDVILSLDTAQRQAAERGHSLLDECRILLLHGVLHLFGYDHELGEEAYNEMQDAEATVMNRLGWKGSGLMDMVGTGNRSGDDDDDNNGGCGGGGGEGTCLHSSSSSSFSSSSSSTSSSSSSSSIKTASSPHIIIASKYKSDIKLLALDMDGTLLNSQSKLLPSSVTAIKSAIIKGVRVFIATGKARPAAVAALEPSGLTGKGMVVDSHGPGVFLQGLLCYGLNDGKVVAGAHLPAEVVESAFAFSRLHNLPLCGFLGEELVTMRMTPELEELHTRYYEPLPRIIPSLEAILKGPSVRKLLFMTTPDVVQSLVRPHWEAALAEGPAAPMQAVDSMLEIVPRGWNKWRALTALLAAADLPRSVLAAVGDGENDLEMVRESGVGVAMGNAVDSVKEVATMVVGSNDEDGIAEAIEKLGLL